MESIPAATYKTGLLLPELPKGVSHQHEPPIQHDLTAECFLVLYVMVKVVF